MLGPRRLPEMARKLGEWTAELRSAAREVRQGLEAEIEELKEIKDDLKAPVDEIKKSAGEVKGDLAIEKDIDQVAGRKIEWKGPKPVSGPTPEDAMADLEEIERKERGEDEG